MADRKPKDDQEEGEKSKSSSSGNFLQIIIIVLLIAVLGLGGFIAWKLKAGHVSLVAGQKSSSTKVKAKVRKLNLPAIIVPLKSITVNLEGAGESRYLHVKIKLAVEGKADQAAIAAFSAQIMDLVITTLSSKTVKDIRTAQGKFALKGELAYRINKAIGHAAVKKIYFSDFVIQ